MFRFIDSGESEKGSRIDHELENLPLVLHSQVDLAELLQESPSVEDYLKSVAAAIKATLPIRSHKLSLSDQILFGIPQRKTDCRLSAAAMGMVMLGANAFDSVNLIYRPNPDIHIAVLGVRQGENHYVDFINHGQGFRVLNFTSDQVAGYAQFAINGKGILKLDNSIESSRYA